MMTRRGGTTSPMMHFITQQALVHVHLPSLELLALATLAGGSSGVGLLLVFHEIVDSSAKAKLKSV